MVHYAFRARNDFVAGREHNLDGCRENEEPGEPFLTLRLSTAWATMTAGAIFPACSRKPPAAMFVRCFTLARPVVPFRPEKRFKGFQRPERDAKFQLPLLPGRVIRPRVFAPCDCPAARFSARPAGPVTGGAVPARCGRCARWPAVPSRCPIRDVPPRRGP